jgi:hypothetical protein
MSAKTAIHRLCWSALVVEQEWAVYLLDEDPVILHWRERAYPAVGGRVGKGWHQANTDLIPQLRWIALHPAR